MISVYKPLLKKAPLVGGAYVNCLRKRSLFGRFVKEITEAGEILISGHAIKGLALLREVSLAVVGSLNREADTALVFIDLNDACFNFSTFVKDVLNFLDALFTNLRYMHETVDIVVEFDECTVTSNLGYLALDCVANLEGWFNVLPRVGGELLHAERNALAIYIHVENGCIDFVAFLHHLGWVIDLTSPGHVGNVHHTVNTLF